MFKAFKYLFYVSLYKRAKSMFIILVASLVLLVVSSLLMNDLIAITTGMTLYLFVLLKWVLILLFIGMIAWSALKIFNIAMDPFSTKDRNSNKDENISSQEDKRKEKILNKEHLFTKSEMILQKYMKD
jgi:CBS domain containing-hemolysin-like protein